VSSDSADVPAERAHGLLHDLDVACARPVLDVLLQVVQRRSGLAEAFAQHAPVADLVQVPGEQRQQEFDDPPGALLVAALQVARP
jgi:hypothetical protein